MLDQLRIGPEYQTFIIAELSGNHKSLGDAAASTVGNYVPASVYGPRKKPLSAGAA
jgi:hypothetical protein